MAKKGVLQRMIKVSKLYYEDNFTQDEIAKKLKISVPQISRIISAAKDQGYVKTYVMDPFSEANDLSKEMISAFGLKDVYIVETKGRDLRVSQTNVAQAGADYLLGILQSNDIVSIAFSDTISKIAQFLPKTHIENISFVQPHGTIFEHVEGFQNDTVRESGLKLDAFYYYFPAPAIVKDKYVRDILHEDPSIDWVLQKAKKSNISLFGITCPSKDSIYVKSGYFSKERLVQIYKQGAVGEIFGHFIDATGEISDPELDARVIGMDISELRKKDYAICISAGAHLVDAIYATLIGKYCNVLITDTTTARKLIDIKASS
jgi:deoxyribonucleoside regulator